MGQVERRELRRDRRLLCERDDDESFTYGGRNGDKWTTTWNKLYGVKQIALGGLDNGVRSGRLSFKFLAR